MQSFSTYKLYPYGMLMPNKHAQQASGDYRYGYQGSEMDNEVKGSQGTSYTTQFRQLDPRVGRWFSIDPKATAWESPYVSMGNNPITYNDILGDTIKSIRSTTSGVDNSKGEEALIDKLQDKTGLDLSFDDDGNMQYAKNEDGTPKIGEGNHSEAARNDLITVINDDKFTVGVQWLENSEHVMMGNAILRDMKSDWDLGIIRMDIGDKFSENRTYDFGIVFLHELQHAYFGLPDIPESQQDDFVGSNADNPEMYPGTGFHKIPPKGPTVERMNFYRVQMGLPIRVTYPMVHEKGLLFNDIKTTTFMNNRGKQKTKIENNYFFIDDFQDK